MIQESRLLNLNDCPVKQGDYVLYWMQSSQRSQFNHALEYAVQRANILNKPVVVYFGLTDSYPEANERHYRFMLEGLKDVSSSLRKKRIKMVVLQDSPEKGAVRLSGEACLVVVDRGYLKIQRQWRSQAAKAMGCPLVQVESDVVVPVEIASVKEEFSAGTLRRKVHRILPDFLIPVKELNPQHSSLDMSFSSISVENIPDVISMLKLDRSIQSVNSFRGGESEANYRLNTFIESRLRYYGTKRNDPNAQATSNLSPYLHFGQISPVKIALEVIDAGILSREAFLEELIVRRELSMNYVYYNSDHDNFNGLPEWAKTTLITHQNDLREKVYKEDVFRNAETHDPYWNAAQKEMIITGKMHGYMRMYWGKKILEWADDPRNAFQIALKLNNSFELDGRDANGFAGVAWCFGKHDRAWFERPVYGKIRYMNANGLRRKFDADAYVKTVDLL